MKLNKWMMRVVTYGLLGIMFFVCSIPTYAWTYNIQWGDSLYTLSRRFGTEVDTLKAVNQLPGDQIWAGGKLWIPDAPQQAQTKATTRAQKVNDGDLYLLARLINGEARGESFTGQVAVGAVILNRVKSGKFPNTIAGNIYKAGEFESVANGQIWQPLTSSAVKAAKAALSGWDPSGGALYFYNPAKITNPYNWIWSRTVINRIGRHVFAL
ncbi:MAG TPA: LysM peptidoglycan-binding domain-containing protein [Hydrogenispora sp.]|jgi:N-acetylmuramoyl-L-alanine amidase|nr:LysM peptidoglycan-binding domain-containing protein [Hydrogenispora sp.]